MISAVRLFAVALLSFVLAALVTSEAIVLLSRSDCVVVCLVEPVRGHRHMLVSDADGVTDIYADFEETAIGYEVDPRAQLACFTLAEETEIVDLAAALRGQSITNDRAEVLAADLRHAAQRTQGIGPVVYKRSQTGTRAYSARMR